MISPSQCSEPSRKEEVEPREDVERETHKRADEAEQRAEGNSAWPTKMPRPSAIRTKWVASSRMDGPTGV